MVRIRKMGLIHIVLKKFGGGGGPERVVVDSFL